MTAQQAPRRFARALIVDDHPLFCDALAMTLGAMSGIATIETASQYAEARQVLVDKGLPDIVFLDLDLPDVTGLDGLVDLVRAMGDAPVVVVSSLADNRMVNAALHAGARGFVPKHSARSVFRAALDTLAAGGRYVPDGFVEEAVAPETLAETDAATARLATLTNQQARILTLICEGKLNKQIAYELSIAETTVKAHVTAMMRKLGVQSRTQAVLLASQARFSNILPNPTDAP